MIRIAALILLSLLVFRLEAQKRKTENIVLVTLDGMRWQEVFNGADSSFMRQQQHLKDNNIKDKFWRDNLDERRKVLFPFIWNTVAKNGQVYGNRNLNCNMNVSNNQWFSYPGYNELLTGAADNERIHSNDKFLNPNKNVLEFIQLQPGFAKKVVAYTSWDVFPYIINDKRSGVMVNAGITKTTGKSGSADELLNKLMTALPNPLGDVRLDAFTFYYGLNYIRQSKPRVVYFAFDETDDFAHGGEYAAYLNSARNTDGYLSELWSYLQSDPAYANKTTLIVTCDHGRGSGVEDWKSHGEKTASSDQIWMAILGPDTPATGEVRSGQYYQNQVARTMSELLGLNYKSDKPAGEAIKGAISPK